MEYGPLRKTQFTLEHLKKPGEKSIFTAMLKEFDRMDNFVFDYISFPDRNTGKNLENGGQPVKLPTQEAKDQGIFRELQMVSTSYKLKTW